MMKSFRSEHRRLIARTQRLIAACVVFAANGAVAQGMSSQEREATLKQLPAACREYFAAYDRCLRARLLPAQQMQRKLDEELAGLEMLGAGRRAEAGCQRQMTALAQPGPEGCATRSGTGKEGAGSASRNSGKPAQ